jgi:23S rRNA (guanosine2251-2'-O)-methyltransferase
MRTQHPSRAPRHDVARRQRPGSDDHCLIFGIHAVDGVLGNPQRSIRRLYLTDNAERRLQATLANRQIAHERVLPRDLERRLGADAVHQGALVETEPLPEPALAQVAASAQASGKPLLVLDQVTDPHNVGAVLRSAAVFGASGLLMTRRHSPPLDGVLAKSASGALEHVPVVQVQNLARALADLKALDISVIGLDASATERLEDMAWPAGAALVLGAEGKGLRQLTRESCDRLARIAADGPFASLNVSNAAAIALHWAVAHRLGLLGGRR